MKTLFIPVKIKSKPQNFCQTGNFGSRKSKDSEDFLGVNKPKILSLSKRLPKNIALVYSVQYQNQAKEIKELLQNSHKITKLVQVLGCSKPNFPKNTSAILLITDGKFHGISLAMETKLPVYILQNTQLTKISKKDAEDFEKRQKTSYVKFLNADKIGILVSTKPGQQNLKKALDFKKKTKKQSYLFISNNLNVDEFENFGLDSWVNTACPRLDMESNSIINMDRLV